MADSSSTVEDSEELTSDEDFDEDYIRPYNFEPILSDTDTKNNSETEFDGVGTGRLGRQAIQYFMVSDLV